MSTTSIRLETICLDGGTQCRVEPNEATIDEYADAYRDGAEFPPVVVFFDGTTYWLADGFHRWHGARRADLESIAADVRQGTLEDAIWHAIGANRTHGLRRTNGDKLRAVQVALERWSEKSDRAIAEQCGVGNKFVGDVRRELCSEHSCQEPAERVGRDGKARKLPTRKPEPIAEPAVEREPGEEGDDWDAWLAAEKLPFADATKAISTILRELEPMAKKNEKAPIALAWVTLKRLLTEAKERLNANTPAEVCDRCGGPGCGYCRETGYLTRFGVKHRDRHLKVAEGT